MSIQHSELPNGPHPGTGDHLLHSGGIDQPARVDEQPAPQPQTQNPDPGMHTILGAGGVIAEGLSRELISHGIPVRLVSRHPVPRTDMTVVAADLTDAGQALRAIRGSSVVYCCIGLPYNFGIWRQQWPAIMNNMIAACGETGAKLIFFDNVYMYGKVEGPMTEETPYDPCSRKGDLRARIATQLMSEVRKGNITAMIARAADFYGPGARTTGIPNLLVFQRMLTNRKAQWLANTNKLHSFTHTGDAARALYLLATDENAWDQAWHLPTAPAPLTGSAFISLAAAALGKTPRHIVLAPWMISLGGLLDRTTRELSEMLYQYQYDYIFDSSKFEKAFNYTPIAYTAGIKATANAYTNDTGF